MSRKAGVVISNENNVYTQIGFQNVVAANTPVFARFRDSGKAVNGVAASLQGRERSHYGLTLPGLGRMGAVQDRHAGQPSSPLAGTVAAPAIRALPPVSEWVSVRKIRAQRATTRATIPRRSRRAIDSTASSICQPASIGSATRYGLRPDTVLLGLHPSLTQIVLPDGTPGYQGIGAPKALVESARGGDAIVAGIGLDTNGVNPRATALLWMAGAQFDGQRRQVPGRPRHLSLLMAPASIPTTTTRRPIPTPARRWDGQYASLWVTAGAAARSPISGARAPSRIPAS